MNTVSFSEYQENIFDFVQNGRGDGVISASAGSGKTFTLVHAAKLVSGSGIFLAFNKHIADELESKLQGTAMSASTIHSLGFRAVRSRFRKTKVAASKYKDIVNRMVLAMADKNKKNAMQKHNIWPTDLERSVINENGGFNGELMRLIDLGRQYLINPKSESDNAIESLFDIIEHFAIDFDPDLESLSIHCAIAAMNAGIREADKSIDFTDMLYIPNILNISVSRFSHIFLDECQDLSPAQLGIAMKARAPGGRILACGDKFQSIMGFAGADSNSFQNIIDKLDAKVMPLSICYRCPTSHLDLARQFCPNIENAPEAIEGQILNLDANKAVDQMKEGDLVICRVNAPLLSFCFKLISEGISASIRGKDIGKNLTKIIRSMFRRKLNDSLDNETFMDKLTEWKNREEEKIRRVSRNESSASTKLELLEDKASCILTVYGSSKAETPQGLIEDIEMLFSNDNPSVVLSSVHRAKGLEADNIYILKQELLGNTSRCKREWQSKQELNLAYVALTRAKKSLVFVSGDLDSNSIPD
jgi:superfamily I DNA/RNA helicase